RPLASIPFTTALAARRSFLPFPPVTSSTVAPPPSKSACLSRYGIFSLKAETLFPAQTPALAYKQHRNRQPQHKAQHPPAPTAKRESAALSLRAATPLASEPAPHNPQERGR